MLIGVDPEAQNKAEKEVKGKNDVAKVRLLLFQGFRLGAGGASLQS